MTEQNCNCRLSCFAKALIASAIVGVLTAFFSFSALITVTPAFLWTLLGIAVGFLGITLFATLVSCRDGERCCRNLTLFLTAILGTVLTSLILLGITFAATSIIGAIITGLLLFFFALTLTSTVCVIENICD